MKDDLVRARLRVTRDEENEIEPEQGSSCPCSPTLQILVDLEMESRGLNDFFPPNELFRTTLHNMNLRHQQRIQRKKVISSSGTRLREIVSLVELGQ